jgi:hypothetical protein
VHKGVERHTPRRVWNPHKGQAKAGREIFLNGKKEGAGKSLRRFKCGTNFSFHFAKLLRGIPQVDHAAIKRNAEKYNKRMDALEKKPEEEKAKEEGKNESER